MKLIKILFITITIILLFYYKLNQDNNTLFEDKLSIFIFVKYHDNIDDILFDLSSQIESFDEYIHNVYYLKNNNFLIRNKLKSQFDQDYVDYKTLLASNNMIDFNIKLGHLIEDYFLEHNSSLHLTKKYLLRDFLVRFYKYFNFQISLFNKSNNLLDINSSLEDFLLGSKYISDYKQEHYLMRVEFIDLNSISKYYESGTDSIFNSILNYNSTIFNSSLLLYSPYSGNNSPNNKFDFQLKQYIKEFKSLDDAIASHKDLILSDNIVLIESMYNYYFKSNNAIENKNSNKIKLSLSISDSNYSMNYKDYKESLLLLEEKLIALQSSDLTNDKIIMNILFDLVGDGNKEGLYSKYINSINISSDYIIDNMNKLFSQELKILFNKIDQTEKEFDIIDIPLEVKKHLYRDDSIRIKYFVK